MHQRVRRHGPFLPDHQCLSRPLALDNVVLAVQGRADAGSSFRFWRPVRDETALFDEARSYLDQVGLSSKTGVVAGQLSHGEQRALELAMALATRPQCCCSTSRWPAPAPRSRRAWSN
jgi:ABC-type branched-subunit amino acid transport system ATPase component